MRCSECGTEALIMKTVYWEEDRDGREYAMCDPCYAGLAERVWIVPGPVPCFGKCRLCTLWFGVRDLSELTGGGKWDAPSGVCEECARA